MRKLLFGLSLLLAFPTILWGRPATVLPAQSLSLVFSSNIQGEVEPCG